MTPRAGPRVKLTVHDYLAIPDDGLRHELLDGEHAVSPSPRVAHQRTVGALFARLRAAIHDPGLGEVLVAPFDVFLGEHDVVQPDVLVVVAAHAGRIRDDGVAGAPDLIVEVLSPATRERDLVTKRQRYAAAGVAEYWIADPDTSTVRQLALRGGAYEDRGTHTDRVRLAILPAVAIELAGVWPDRGPRPASPR